MKIIETEAMVGQEGKLIIPDCVINRIGLEQGDTLKLAFISNSLDDNMFECCIVADGTAGADEPDISISNELLEAANIPLNSDIGITCTDGAIIITASDLLTMIPCELCQLFDELGISPEAVPSVTKNETGGTSDGK